MPASEGGLGGFLAALMGGPSWHKGRCVMLSRKGKCTIHTSGFKPKQCRETRGCAPEEGPDNYAIAPLWDNAKGRAVVAKWRKAVAL